MNVPLDAFIYVNIEYQNHELSLCEILLNLMGLFVTELAPYDFALVVLHIIVNEFFTLLWVKLILALLSMPIRVRPSINRYRMFFDETSTVVPRFI